MEYAISYIHDNPVKTKASAEAFQSVLTVISNTAVMFYDILNVAYNVHCGKTMGKEELDEINVEIYSLTQLRLDGVVPVEYNEVCIITLNLIEPYVQQFAKNNFPKDYDYVEYIDMLGNIVRLRGVKKDVPVQTDISN